MVQLRLNPAPSSWGCICKKREREGGERKRQGAKRQKGKKKERTSSRKRRGEGNAGPRGSKIRRSSLHGGTKTRHGWKRESFTDKRGDISRGDETTNPRRELHLHRRTVLRQTHDRTDTHTHTYIRVTDRHLPSRPLITLSTEAREREVRHPFP